MMIMKSTTMIMVWLTVEDQIGPWYAVSGNEFGDPGPQTYNKIHIGVELLFIIALLADLSVEFVASDSYFLAGQGEQTKPGTQGWVKQLSPVLDTNFCE